ncbi:GNAT family N-acetyltransferase [Saccharomonospora iraqiensis]|uniref:GNAT family N-acetyltransferase n=1 Tax=Saccharomonospora iraqiensis TaxID=52698 RepID=UPI00040D5396|nr:GNAT family N-acetyltransferase [Saccharomonospora iraqiensis]
MDHRIRRVRDADVETVVTLVHELAEYEKAPQECHLTAGQLRTALFGPAPALYGHVAEVDGRIVGFALWFLNFSTWRGVHGIYLEDLFVRPEARGTGLGRALLAALAGECVRHGYARLEWWVLDWNPAVGFYTSLGAEAMDEWTVYRLTDEPLRRLAADPAGPA